MRQRARPKRATRRRVDQPFGARLGVRLDRLGEQRAVVVRVLGRREPEAREVALHALAVLLADAALHALDRLDHGAALLVAIERDREREHRDVRGAVEVRRRVLERVDRRAGIAAQRQRGREVDLRGDLVAIEAAERRGERGAAPVDRVVELAEAQVDAGQPRRGRPRWAGCDTAYGGASSASLGLPASSATGPSASRTSAFFGDSLRV